MATGASADSWNGFLRDNASNFKVFGLGSGLIGGGLSAVAQLQAGRAEARAMRQNASNLRMQAQGQYESALADEYLQRMNQNESAGQARAAQAVSGFMGSGTGSAGEQTLMRQFELGIAQAAVQRENQRRSALYQADVMDWQAKQAKRSATLGAIGTVIGTLGSAAMGAAGGNWGTSVN